MKKVVLGILLTLTFLTGCDSATVNEVPKDEDSRFNGVNGSVKIVTDSETNCKYIYIERGMGDARTTAMSPLMKNSGQVDCD